jgi:prefoldin subunit 5
MKEYERKLDEADDIMCEYENQIELLKSQIKELNDQHDDLRKTKRSRTD